MSEGEAGPRRLPSGRHKLPSDLVTEDQRRRLLEAAIAVAGERGYAEMPVAAILETAGVSRATFYELFEDKLACFLAAFELAADSLLSEASAACDRSGPWRERLGLGLERLLARLAADPALARVVLIEIGVAGPAGRRRYRAALQRFAPLLEEGIEAEAGTAEVSPNTAQMAIGGAVAALTREVAAGRAAALPSCLDEVRYAVLLPIAGPEGAAGGGESGDAG